MQHADGGDGRTTDTGIGREVMAVEVEKAEKSIIHAPRGPASGPSGEAPPHRCQPRQGLSARYGANELWWCRLKSALGIQSSAFVNACLFQLQAAARLPGSGISEIAVNAALAMIEAAQPRDEIEAALAVQMACTHTMAVLARLGGGSGGERRVAALGSAAARLLRAYACQVEALRRLRGGDQQLVRVEHVHVHDGGQAVVGEVSQR